MLPPQAERPPAKPPRAAAAAANGGGGHRIRVAHASNQPGVVVQPPCYRGRYRLRIDVPYKGSSPPHHPAAVAVRADRRVAVAARMSPPPLSAAISGLATQPVRRHYSYRDGVLVARRERIRQKPAAAMEGGDGRMRPRPMSFYGQRPLLVNQESARARIRRHESHYVRPPSAFASRFARQPASPYVSDMGGRSVSGEALFRHTPSPVGKHAGAGFAASMGLPPSVAAREAERADRFRSGHYEDHHHRVRRPELARSRSAVDQVRPDSSPGGAKQELNTVSRALDIHKLIFESDERIRELIQQASQQEPPTRPGADGEEGLKCGHCGSRNVVRPARKRRKAQVEPRSHRPTSVARVLNAGEQAKLTRFRRMLRAAAIDYHTLQELVLLRRRQMISDMEEAVDEDGLTAVAAAAKRGEKVASMRRGKR